jgi:hypothetical protein
VQQNRLAGRVRDRRPGHGVQRQRIELENGRTVDAVFPDSSYTILPLDPGAAVEVVLRRDAWVVLPVPDAALTR